MLEMKRKTIVRWIAFILSITKVVNCGSHSRSGFCRWTAQIVGPFIACGFLVSTHAVAAETSVSSPFAQPASSQSYSKSRATGIEYYDYTLGDGVEAKLGDRVVFNYKGRLAGRQGWIYADTFTDGTDPVRMTLGSTDCIEGLRLGIVGADEDLPPMRKGGKRRLVIPARLGYKNKDQIPVPEDFGQRQRLYSTVLNNIRTDREAAALGDSLAGKVVLDVELLKVYPPKNTK